MNETVAAVLGLGFLAIFYRVVRSQWPTHYFRFDSWADPVLTRTAWRYLAYRLAPYYLVAVVIIVTLERQKRAGLLSAFIACVGHALLTNGRVLLRYLQRGQRRRVAQVVLQLAVFLSAPVMVLLAYATRDVVASIVPSPRDLSVALWTGALAAILAFFVTDVWTGISTDPSKTLSRAAADLPEELVVCALRASEKYDISPELPLAIIIVENAQRPPWARRFERIKGKVLKPGTYGIMQVRCAAPVTDQESVEIACRDHLRGQRLPIQPVDPATAAMAAQLGIDPTLSAATLAPMTDFEALEKLIKTYNPSDDYAELVASVVGDLVSYPDEVFAADYRARVLVMLADSSSSRV